MEGPKSHSIGHLHEYHVAPRAQNFDFAHKFSAILSAFVQKTGTFP